MFSERLDKDFLYRLKDEFSEHLSGKVAVKLHFGEPGNKHALTPEMVKPITDLLDDFFLFDSSVMYGGKRGAPDTHKKYATEKGWGNLGEVVTDDETILVKGKHMHYEVCRRLSEADSVLVLTHFKGHICCGFGGAIKNLGMGALSKSSKAAIHEGGKPVLGEGCIGCGECAIGCPLKSIKMVDGRPEIGLCFGCSNCVLICKHGALRAKHETFDNLLADGAIAALMTFKKVYFVNIIKNLTKLCDCMGDPEEIMGSDIGYLAGDDMVKIDRMSYEAVVNVHGDIFLKNNKRTGLEHVRSAEKIINSE